jgi:ATP-dependent DNA ligase
LPVHTRRHDWASRFPWIVEAALKNRQKQFVIDGEAVHARLGLRRFVLLWFI